MAEQIHSFSLAIEETDAPEVREYKTLMWVKAQCGLASGYIDDLYDPDPQTRQQARAHYLKHRDGVIKTALSIKDEFSHGLAIHHVIKLCRDARQLEVAKKLFREVGDDFLRDQIINDVPELANEKKARLSDEEKARRSVTINLDGLDRNTIINLVVKAMQNVDAPRGDIAQFKELAINAPSYEKMLMFALTWAPVRFVKDGRPWVTGDWRRLSELQRVERRLSLWFKGGYQHPDGDYELDFHEKAGIDPRDDEHVKEAKVDAYIKQDGVKDVRGDISSMGWSLSS